MLESDIRALFARMAASDQPSSRVSVPAAFRQGRALRRRQRMRTVASPVLAAVAVLAIVLTGSVPASLLGTRHSPAAGASTAAPRAFSPLRPYVSLGWLPKGDGPGQVNLDRSSVEISFDGYLGAIIAFSADRCQLTGRVLTCPPELGNPLPARQHLGREAGLVHGRPAYWMPPVSRTTGTLAWPYARGGWAEVTAFRLSTALKIAANARFGPDTAPPVRFGMQLTGVPSGWRVTSVGTTTGRNGQLSEQYLITTGSPAPGNELVITTGPADHSKLACQNSVAPHHATRVINGYRVEISHATSWQTQGTRITMSLPWQLCAPDADGRNVMIALGSHPAMSITELFAHHLRLLGADPANWTTSPIAP